MSLRTEPFTGHLPIYISKDISIIVSNTKNVGKRLKQEPLTR